ncbi:cytochrome c551 [Metabacillus crassostreae]|uniref:cytochrome c551 n=1 Tax=Metabacillus crassostreae TaxID=929098 RepID=UPI00195C586D|nr:cytochrome c [Metabacillus crassostreae]MBM7606217.1 cytochrome c551 [Metabacillus crassostreae]
MKHKLLALLLGTSVILGACGGAEEPADEADSTEGTTTASGDAEEIYQQNCIGCHGRNLEGASGPNLTEVGGKYDQAAIESIILNGQGNMPKGLLNEADAEVVASWLAEKK